MNRVFEALSVGFIFCLSLSGCEKQEPAKTAAPLEISAIKISKSDIPLSMEFIGQTKGSVDAEIRARVEGVIVGMHFEEGKEVQEGQLLYSIDPAPLQANVAEAQGKLAEAQTKLTKAQSDLKRVRPLVQMKALSERDLDAAVAQEGSAKGAVDAASAALEAAKIQLSYCKITSPVKGIIGLTKAKVGEFVGRAPNPVVLNTVSQLNPINVRLSVNEKEYLYFMRLKQAQIAAGKPAEKRTLHMILADNSQYPEAGEVASVDREIDPKTGTIAVEASFPNEHLLIRPGQFAKITTVAETLSGVLAVPKRALRELQGQYQALVVKPDNSIETRNVKVGSAVGDKQIVEEGLNENEVLATSGLQQLRSGSIVTAKLEG